MADYEFWLTDDAGRPITPLKGISFASYSRTTRGLGTIQLGIPFDAFKVSPIFLPDRRIVVYRKPSPESENRREGSFFLRKWNAYAREDGVIILEFYGRSPLDILRRESVVPFTTADSTKATNIDTMMQEIVQENFLDRLVVVPDGEFSIDGSTGLGPAIVHEFLGQNVLDILKDLKSISFSMNATDPANRRIFFDVVEGAALNGGFGYVFRTYADLRGQDRSNGVVFSMENGNIAKPSYYEDHLDSFTLADVINPSDSPSSTSQSSPDRYLSRWNASRVYRQSSSTSLAENDASAYRLLTEVSAQRVLGVTFLNSPGSPNQPRSLYGIDWDLGDLLPVQFIGKRFTAEVTTVWVSVNDKGEENIVGLSDAQ